MPDIGGWLRKKKDFLVTILKDNLLVFSPKVLKLSQDQAQGFSCHCGVVPDGLQHSTGLLVPLPSGTQCPQAEH